MRHKGLLACFHRQCDYDVQNTTHTCNSNTILLPHATLTYLRVPRSGGPSTIVISLILLNVLNIKILLYNSSKSIIIRSRKIKKVVITKVNIILV